MRIFTTLFLCVIVSSIIQAQTTINYDLNNTNIHFSPTPTGGGFSPQSNYATITKPLVAEPYAANPQAGVNAATIYVPAGNVNDVFFGGDIPITGIGLGAQAVPIFTKQTFSQADFPIYLECNFYSRMNVPLYNESYLLIMPSNYQYFASPTTYTPQQTAQREGVLFGGHPNNLRVFDHRSATQASVITDYPHSFASNGNWYNTKILLDYVNGNLVIRSAKVNNNTVITNSNLGSYTWLNSLRLGIAADDMAEGFQITTNYSDMVADFNLTDTIICEGECINFTSFATTSFCTNCNTYQWSFPGSSTSSSTSPNPNNICFPNSGTYPVTLIVSNTVEADTITKMVTVTTLSNVDLGNDTILCNGQSITIDATVPNATYLWSNNTTNPTLTVNSTGTYAVTVTQNNCTGSDTINVIAAPSLSIDLGNDTILCTGETLLLDVISSNSTYQWQDGTTASTYTVNQSGSYSVMVSNGCSSGTDTIVVQYETSQLTLELGNDTTICAGQTLVLEVTNSDINDYQWQDGTTTSTYAVNQAGSYSVTVSNSCVAISDTIEVMLEENLLQLDLGNDTIICQGQPFILNVMNSTADRYLWQDNSTNPTFSITQSGTYFVAISNSCFSISDSVSIVVTDDSPLLDLGEDKEGCIGDEVTIDGTTINANAYLWNDGSTSSILEVAIEGQYVLTAFNDCGSSVDSIFVNFIDCNCYVGVPNVFSPNGDNYNNTFSPKQGGVCDFVNYKFMIFNRWGNLVFETTDFSQYWDGIYNSQEQPMDTYTWIVEYELATGVSEILKGSVLLVR